MRNILIILSTFIFMITSFSSVKAIGEFNTKSYFIFENGNIVKHKISLDKEKIFQSKYIKSSILKVDNVPVYYLKRSIPGRVQERLCEMKDEKKYAFYKLHPSKIEDHGCFAFALSGLNRHSLVSPALTHAYIGDLFGFYKNFNSFYNEYFIENKQHKDLKKSKAGHWFFKNRDYLDQIKKKYLNKCTTFKNFERSFISNNIYIDRKVEAMNKDLIKKIIKANGFEIIDVPTPYSINVHYERDGGLNWDHWWIRVDNLVIETFPTLKGMIYFHKNMEQLHDGKTVLRFYIKDININHKAVVNKFLNNETNFSLKNGILF